ncbi:MGH1-like glycoside hydrolase domain-containing protein [Actinophytocola sp.]|uniref:MGH1-like glycoside hydrolase domain-containing protein n=1 Tax=Actinophytocola sp. TaxID=1872138 RepID=UPI002D569134|nr:glycogen debranching protein [Actinophytocola sp.]HYQ68059.1 glycogen debranching protein [Actinophytocola sp.]
MTRDSLPGVPRRSFFVAGGAVAAGGALAAAGAPVAMAAPRPGPRGPRRVEYTLPTLVFDDAGRQGSLGAMYEAALTGLIGINTVYADPGTYDHAHRISYPPGTFVRAGGGYPSPQRWTRDAAVNAWNAASLLGPVVGANTLWAVVDQRSDGTLIVQQDNQWWDQIIWVVAAWHHYRVTGDRTFLADAYRASTATLAARTTQHFNADYGLFRGPSFMNDGIAGYPSPPWADGVGSSFVLDYPHTDELMCLSTNCLYYGAYLSLAGMAEELHRSGDASARRGAAAALRQAINRHLWREDAGTYGYLVHGGDELAGQLDPSQEGAGLAFAVLFGVADARRTRRLLDGTHWQPKGIVNVWPHFPRFSDDRPGRHNVIVWPMVHSMFGHAAAAGGRPDLFGRAVTGLAELVSASDGNFYEIYNSATGTVDGGWQTGNTSRWTSQPDQAWSASGYLRLIYSGLFGLTFAPDRLTLTPTLPPGWGSVGLYGLPYRDITLNIELSGTGNRVRSCTIDGRPGRPTIDGSGTGEHTVRITLGS